MVKYVVAVVILVVVCFSLYYLRETSTHVRIKEIHEFASMKSVGTIREGRAGVKLYDDTLALCHTREPYVLSTKNISHYHQEPEQHPEIRHRYCKFFVDDSTSTDSTLIISLFGTLSGGNAPEGTAFYRGDTLILMYWKAQMSEPAVGAFFKWSLIFEIRKNGIRSPSAIAIVDRQRCYVDREIYLHDHNLSLLKDVCEYYWTASHSASHFGRNWLNRRKVYTTP